MTIPAAKKDFLPLFLIFLIIEGVCLYLVKVYFITGHLVIMISAYLAIFALHLFALRYLLKLKGKKLLFFILITSLVFRATLLFTQHSDDVNRFLWEAKIDSLGYNPYLLPPESEELKPFRDSIYQEVQHKDIASVYPPLALLVFRIAASVSYTRLSIKIALLIFDMATVYFLIRLLALAGQHEGYSIIYAWSPLTLISVASQGHPDSIMLFFVVLALYLYLKKLHPLVYISFALALGAKYFCLPMFPFLVTRKNAKYVFLSPITLLLLFLPYIGGGLKIFEPLYSFGTDFHYNDTIHFAARYVWENIGAEHAQFFAHLTLAIFLLGLAAYLLYKRRDPLYSSFVMIGALLLSFPTLHQWYLLWMLPFLVLYRSRAWIALVGSSVFYYLVLWGGPDWPDRENHWLRLPFYGPFVLVLTIDKLLKWRKKRRGLRYAEKGPHNLPEIS